MMRPLITIALCLAASAAAQAAEYGRSAIV
jgi:hypothetical protein